MKQTHAPNRDAVCSGRARQSARRYPWATARTRWQSQTQSGFKCARSFEIFVIGDRGEIASDGKFFHNSARWRCNQGTPRAANFPPNTGRGNSAVSNIGQRIYGNDRTWLRRGCFHINAHSMVHWQISRASEFICYYLAECETELRRCGTGVGPLSLTIVARAS